MMSIHELLKRFSNLLVSSWEDLSVLSRGDHSGSFIQDWTQANWELIVERMIDQENLVLEPYADGSDCNGASSRILYPDRVPTHKIICKSKNNQPLYDILNQCNVNTSLDEFVFDRLVSMGKDGWYYELPPFDKVLAEYAGEIAVLDFNYIDFQLQHINEV